MKDNVWMYVLLRVRSDDDKSMTHLPTAGRVLARGDGESMAAMLDERYLESRVLRIKETDLPHYEPDRPAFAFRVFVNVNVKDVAVAGTVMDRTILVPMSRKFSTETEASEWARWLTAAYQIIPVAI